MAAAHPVGVIGPNAVIQLGEALRAMLGEQRAAGLYRDAGCASWFATPPDAMVDERRTAALHQALRRDLPEDAARILAEAGRRTGDYILAHRIPQPAQWLLRHLPAGLAGPLLLDAITRHAWTFAGTGRFSARRGRPCLVEIEGNPLVAGERAAAPVCVWHEAVFRRLFQELVHPYASVREIACGATGGSACRFEIAWNRRAPA
jgi:divinyl protochlorophyllide a 8-vinyl-reductase